MSSVPFHYDRPLPLQVLLAHVVPLLFGAVCGIALGVSKPAYAALSLVAAIGGFLSGLEHDGPLDAASRGLAGGLLFGAGILIAHAVAGTDAKATLPDPEALLMAITAVAGAVLAGAGGAIRRALERRQRTRAAP